MFVGEQPGNKEDLEGEPFVGPAGSILRKALSEAKINLSEIYITNAVKHFKWIKRGKARIHQKPTIIEIRACSPWLEAEIKVIKPKIIVCLGASAASALVGSQARIGRDRGKPISSSHAKAIFITAHPASVLRAPIDLRKKAMDQLISDLKKIKKYLLES